MIGIFAMFFILFKNIRLSFIGIVPNFIAAFFILGIIGLLRIPLDMMTITIAAITIGIAVDNSIHYIYRFKEEFSKIKDYKKDFKYMSFNCRCCNFEYLGNNCIWFFNFSFIEIYSNYLFWNFYWSCNVVSNDFCVDTSSIVNISV